MNRILLAACFSTLLGASAAAQGGLVIMVAPNPLTTGGGSELVTITLCNMAPNTAYHLTLQVVDGNGTPVPGYTITVMVTSDDEGKAIVQPLVELAVGNYKLNGTAVTPVPPATPTQTLTGAVVFSSV